VQSGYVIAPYCFVIMRKGGWAEGPGGRDDLAAKRFATKRRAASLRTRRRSRTRRHWLGLYRFGIDLRLKIDCKSMKQPPPASPGRAEDSPSEAEVVLLLAANATSTYVFEALKRYLEANSNLQTTLGVIHPDRRIVMDDGWVHHVRPSELTGKMSLRLKGTDRLSVLLSRLWRLRPTRWIGKGRDARSPRVESRLAAIRDSAVRLMSELRVTLLVVSDDRALALLPVIQAARTKGVSVLVLPVARSNDRGPFLRRIGDPKHGAGTRSLWPEASREMLDRMPGQGKTADGETVFFYDLPTTLALADLDMLPSNPWVVGSGLSDWVAVNSAEARDGAVQAGVAPDRIVMTGHLSHDRLFNGLQRRNEIRNRLAADYGLDLRQPLALFAVPQFYEHGMMSEREQLAGLEGILDAFDRSPFQVIISLHPKSNPEQYRKVVAAHSAAILVESLDQVLPAADIFMAGSGSSTIEWAIILGCPVIAIDFSNFHYELYDQYETVLTATSPLEVEQHLVCLAEDPSLFEDLKRRQIEYGTQIAVLDGGAGARIMDLVEGLAYGRLRA
jgi:hypothetical protein